MSHPGTRFAYSSRQAPDWSREQNAMSEPIPVADLSKTTRYGPPVCTPEPFPIQEPWPFAQGEQCIFVFAEPTHSGCRVWGEWHPADAAPEGFLLARLPYEVAGDVDRLMSAVAPIFDCWMRMGDDRNLARDLMHAASLLCYLLEQHQTPQAEEWFERQYLGYETHRLSAEEGG